MDMLFTVVREGDKIVVTLNIANAATLMSTIFRFLDGGAEPLLEGEATNMESLAELIEDQLIPTI